MRTLTINNETYYEFIEPILIEIEKGYQQLLTKSCSSTNIFSEELDNAIQKRLPLLQRLIIRKCTQLTHNGLLACRKNEINSSSQYFKEFQDLFANSKINLSEEAQSLILTFYHGAYAYLCYKKQDYILAKVEIEKALALDAKLLSISGDYLILEMHRIQLLHNLIRVTIKEDINIAIQQSLELLLYVYYPQKGGYITITPLSDYSQISILLQSEMYYQIFNEFCLLLVKSPNKNTIIDNYLSKVSSSSKSKIQYAINGLITLKIEKNKEMNSYFSALLAFLKSIPNVCPNLWNVVVCDFCQLILRFDNQTIIQDEKFQFILNIPSISKLLKNK